MLSVVRFPLDWLKDQYLVPSSSSIDFLLLRLFKLWVCFRLYDFLWICPYSSSSNVVEKWKEHIFSWHRLQSYHLNWSNNNSSQTSTGVYELVGAVSWGRNCAKSFGVYADVPCMLFCISSVSIFQVPFHSFPLIKFQFPCLHQSSSISPNLMT